ncbi:MAG: T9SS type A sorting domain-containing protein, partial [Ignavibacteria bacterium]
GVALYNGTSFSALGSGCGSGFYPYVFTIVSNGTDLYVGGLYTVAGGLTVNGIAKWDGSSWSALGNGLTAPGNAYGAYGICLFNGQIIATGIFNSPSNNIAAWGTITGINNNQTTPDKFELSQNYPNPFNPTTNIHYSVPKSGMVKLVVFDALGREIQTLVNESQQAGTYEASFSGSNYPSGVYFYKITAGDFIETKRMLLVK